VDAHGKVPDMDGSSEDIAKAVAAISRIDAVPTLLTVLCETTGMRFAVVARVTDTTWTACAVKDDIHFGVIPGGQLAVGTTLCAESRASRAPIVIEHGSLDPVYQAHPALKLYSIESHVSVPIILGDGRYFGDLCALDPNPAKVALDVANLMHAHMNGHASSRHPTPPSSLHT
jgi:hypothetical protein